MKYSLIYIILFLSLPVYGQTSIMTDTISIGEVVISGKKERAEPAGYKVSSVDSSVMRISSQMSLAELLTIHSTIYIKSYGMGGTASPSFRGTGAGHTQLTWNDININHPMLGQSDLSLVPAGLIDDIKLYYGGASMPKGSGGIGGTISLETAPVWKKETLISLNPGIGSFGSYTGLVKVRTGNAAFQSVTKAFYQSAENDFPYLNTEISSEPVWQRRTNSQVKQKGLIQELYFRRGKNVTSARVWYEDTDRNLPSSMLIQQPDHKETQSDVSLRTMVSLDHNTSLTRFSATGAVLLNKLNYTNSLASIDSRNNSGTMVLKSGLERKAGSHATIRFGADDTYDLVKSNNYAGTESRNTLSLTAAAERNEGVRLGTSLLVRELICGHSLLVPDFSAGMKFRMITGKEFFLNANVSRNSKIPSMNDLYWSPGGNPDLKNEYAFMYEIGADLSHSLSHVLTLKYNLSAFRNNIRDMIQWHQSQYAYWIADNIKSVNTGGLEASASLNYSVPGFSAWLTAGYTFTKATTAASETPGDAAIGRQLIYVPVHQANTSLNATYRKFYSSWIISMTGIRYTSADNQDFLPGYALNDLVAGYRADIKGNTVDLSFRVDNLFNTSYQAIAYYPMPGRSYSLKMLFQILK